MLRVGQPASKLAPLGLIWSMLTAMIPTLFHPCARRATAGAAIRL